MNKEKFPMEVPVRHWLSVIGIFSAIIISPFCHADYHMDGLSVVYTANVDGQYQIDGDSENSQAITQGQMIRLATGQSLSIRGESFKESFVPASRVPNLNRLLGTRLPPAVLPQTLVYQYFNGASGKPVCRALVIDPGLQPAAAVPASMKRLIKSLQSNSVDYQLASGHLVINCLSR